MARKLKVWNGRAYGILPASQWKRGGEPVHIYACAYSVADLQNLCDEPGLHRVPASEVRNYWSSCWGKPMQGIEPERGIWLAAGYSSKPERIPRPTPEAK
jgi:hypothetical protein